MFLILHMFNPFEKKVLIALYILDIVLHLTFAIYGYEQWKTIAPGWMGYVTGAFGMWIFSVFAHIVGLALGLIVNFTLKRVVPEKVSNFL